MEWLETTAKTLNEAKNIALDQLGVAEDEAEFEILEEPKAGLFGRLRGEARVRTRIRPVHPRSKNERSRKPRVARDETSVSRADVPEAKQVVVVSTPEEEAKRAEDFLQSLSRAFALPANIRSNIRESGDVDLALDGDQLGVLIGPRGQTLQAVQELTRLVAQPFGRTHDGRLYVDIGGYKERRSAALVAFTEKQAEQVLATGTACVFEPMSAPDRKIVHDAAATIEGIVSRSQGEDPKRSVVIERG
jgi:spoIIIJ-associated protein